MSETTAAAPRVDRQDAGHHIVVHAGGLEGVGGSRQQVKPARMGGGQLTEQHLVGNSDAPQPRLPDVRLRRALGVVRLRARDPGDAREDDVRRGSTT